MTGKTVQVDLNTYMDIHDGNQTFLMVTRPIPKGVLIKIFTMEQEMVEMSFISKGCLSHKDIKGLLPNFYIVSIEKIKYE